MILQAQAKQENTSVNGVALNPTGQPLTVAELRQRACSELLRQAAMARGLLCYPMGGTVDGLHGDHVLLAPPFTATRDELQRIATLLAESVDAVTAPLG